LYTHILENELFPTTTVQQRQHVDAVRVARFSWLVSMFVFDIFKFLVGASRFVVGTLHTLALPWLLAWAK
jgi:hypothetical protein